MSQRPDYALVERENVIPSSPLGRRTAKPGQIAVPFIIEVFDPPRSSFAGITKNEDFRTDRHGTSFPSGHVDTKNETAGAVAVAYLDFGATALISAWPLSPLPANQLDLRQKNRAAFRN